MSTIIAESRPNWLQELKKDDESNTVIYMLSESEVDDPVKIFKIP